MTTVSSPILIVMSTTIIMTTTTIIIIITKAITITITITIIKMKSSPELITATGMTRMKILGMGIIIIGKILGVMRILIVIEVRIYNYVCLDKENRCMKYSTIIFCQRIPT